MHVRVATYNVLDPGFGTLAPWEQRRDNVVRTIIGAAAGIVALQEADFSALARELDVPAHLARATGLALSPAAAGGSRILYDAATWRAAEHGVVLLPRSRGDHRRSAIWQRFTSAESAVLVVNTHLSHGRRDAARARQARAIVRRLAAMHRMPTIVMGDLNSWHGRTRTTPMSVFARAGFTDVRPAPLPGLDHIAVSRGVTVASAGIERPPLPGPASDHRLLWADLIVQSRVGGGV